MTGFPIYCQPITNRTPMPPIGANISIETILDMAAKATVSSDIQN